MATMAEDFINCSKKTWWDVSSGYEENMRNLSLIIFYKKKNYLRKKMKDLKKNKAKRQNASY